MTEIQSNESTTAAIIACAGYLASHDIDPRNIAVSSYDEEDTGKRMVWVSATVPIAWLLMWDDCTRKELTAPSGGGEPVAWLEVHTDVSGYRLYLASDHLTPADVPDPDEPLAGSIMIEHRRFALDTERECHHLDSYDAGRL